MMHASAVESDERARAMRPRSPLRRLIHYVESEQQLDRLDRRLQRAVSAVAERLPGGQRTIDVLNGTPLGHPAHPLLTHIPIGAYAFAAVFDVASAGRARHSKAATALIAMGLLSTVPTALAGAMDWQHTSGKARRVGVAHALLNSIASGVFTLSLLSRLSGRGPARALNLTGNAIVAGSGYLGGHLVFDARIGPRYHDDDPPSEFVAVLAESDLAEGALKRVEANSSAVVLLRQNGQVMALPDTCPHLGCSLAEGIASVDAVVCGCHGSAFSFEDGRVLRGPSAFPLTPLTVRVRNGQIEVAARPVAAA